MKLHLECERTIHFQKVDGTQGVLKEGAQAYMHFITSKKIDIWMRATVLELHDEGLRVQSDDGLRWNFFYSDLKDVSTQKPDAVTRAEVERLINFLRPVPHTSLPDCFVQAVALLTRPYHRLTEQQAAVIRKMAMENDCDVLEDCCTGQQYVPFPVSWTVKMKKKQKETQDILSYHTQAAGCSDKARAKASGGRQPIEECGRTGL